MNTPGPEEWQDALEQRIERVTRRVVFLIHAALAFVLGSVVALVLWAVFG